MFIGDFFAIRILGELYLPNPVTPMFKKLSYVIFALILVSLIFVFPFINFAKVWVGLVPGFLMGGTISTIMFLRFKSLYKPLKTLHALYHVPVACVYFIDNRSKFLFLITHVSYYRCLGLFFFLSMTLEFPSGIRTSTIHRNRVIHHYQLFFFHLILSKNNL